jgi:hypothetical protein
LVLLVCDIGFGKLGGGGTAETIGALSLSETARKPSAIPLAPKSKKHPKMTESPRLISIRPDSIAKPTQAVAITAIAVAKGPKRRSLTQLAAEAIALPELGSTRLACWVVAITVMNAAQSR